MGTVHDFKERLALSHKYADAPWWLDCYESAFPNLKSCVEVRDDGWAQRAGIDRILTLGDGKVIKIDEKVREKDYGDILLEFWSNREGKVRGWICKPLDCDFIAYAIVQSSRCYLLPTLLLQKAWRDFGPEWCRRAQSNERGFRFVDAKNNGYTTRSIAIPVDVLMSGITGAITVGWKVEPDHE